MKKMYYLILDTETATLPFAKNLSEEDRKKIAIAKPLVYDIGWVIIDRNGKEILSKNYLVQETFFVPAVFDTAYYKDKRPLYMAMYKNGEITSKNWYDILNELSEDMKKVDYLSAYNACFDFKKAIPFTNCYIDALYSNFFDDFMEVQEKKCEKIINNNDDSQNSDYLKPLYSLNGIEKPICDLWGYSCKVLLNNEKFRKFCINNGFCSASQKFFSTSAQTVFRYINKDETFIEQHTALDDARIESMILSKILKRKSIEPSIIAFPFRIIGRYDQHNQK